MTAKTKYTYQANPEHVSRARMLRRNQSNCEMILWQKLRNRQVCDLKFRRQFPINRYILDFYCPEKKLAIELDGGHHSESKHITYDKKREKELLAEGIETLRFWDNDILTNIEGVLQKIVETIK